MVSSPASPAEAAEQCENPQASVPRRNLARPSGVDNGAVLPLHTIGLLCRGHDEWQAYRGRPVAGGLQLTR
jgi:hypothetical protein